MRLKKTVMGLTAGFAFAALGLSTAAFAQTSYKIGTEGGYPPWSMVDAKGTVTGFDADVGAALCTKLDADCSFVVQSFDSLIPSLDAKRLRWRLPPTSRQSALTSSFPACLTPLSVLNV